MWQELQCNSLIVLSDIVPPRGRIRTNGMAIWTERTCEACQSGDSVSCVVESI